MARSDTRGKNGLFGEKWRFVWQESWQDQTLGAKRGARPLLSLCFYSADALLLLMFYSAVENSAERWEAQTEKIRDGGSQEYKLKNPDLKNQFFQKRVHL